MERVGQSRTRKVDVRVVSASNADLQEEVAHNRFREDLLFRLNTIEIHLPPLRDRRMLLENPWQGNVRELSHVVERAVLMAQDTLIRPGDIAVRAAREAPQKIDEMSLEEVERFLIRKALARHGRGRLG
jgi:DNA-binding NtrC family response regulator